MHGRETRRLECALKDADMAMNRNETVSLGCGTLIIIALIVMFLGNANQQDLATRINEMQKNIDALTESIRRIENKLDEQTKDIESIRRNLARDRDHPEQ
jgi:peptidoglycan hydrolase CwlO-like protein